MMKSNVMKESVQRHVKKKNPGTQKMTFVITVLNWCEKLLKRNKEQEDPLSQDQITAPKIRCSDSNFESNEITNEENKNEKKLDDFNINERIDKLISKGAPDNFRILLESQIQNGNSDLDIRQRRWDSKIISLCLTIYCK